MEVKEPVDGKVVGPIYQGSTSEVQAWVREHYSMLLTECLSNRTAVSENSVAYTSTRIYATWLDVYNALDTEQRKYFRRENGYIYPLTLQALLFLPVVKGQLSVKYAPGEIKKGYYVEPFYIVTGYNSERVTRTDKVLAIANHKICTISEGNQVTEVAQVFGGPDRISAVHMYADGIIDNQDKATELILHEKDCTNRNNWPDVCVTYNIGSETPPPQFQITVSFGLMGGSFSGNVAVQPPRVAPDWDPGLNDLSKPSFDDVVNGGMLSNGNVSGVVKGGVGVTTSPVITTPSLYTYKLNGEIYFSVYPGLASFQLSSAAVPLSKLDSLNINQAKSLGLSDVPLGTPEPMQTGSGLWVINFRGM